MAGKSQAPLEAHEAQKAKFTKLRKTAWWLVFLVRVAWVWFVEAATIGLIGWFVYDHTSIRDPRILAGVAFGLAMTQHTFRYAMAKNVLDTLSARVLLSCRIRAIEDFRFPRVEKVEFNGFLNFTAAMECLAANQMRSYPVTGGKLRIRPRAHQGEEGWEHAFEDYMRRKFRFPSAGVSRHEKDPNKMYLFLNRQELPDVLIGSLD